MPRQRFSHPLATLYAESPLPIYLLDDQRRIVACNPACSDWLGIAAEQLIGQRCDYVANEVAPVEQAAAAALCPPPASFQGERQTGHIVWRSPAGQLLRRFATFLPLREEEPAPVLVLLSGKEAELPVESHDEGIQAADLHERLQALARRQRARYRLDQLVGNSPAIRRVREQIALATTSRARVLLLGPSGSGREHVARTIHYASAPAHDPTLFSLDCSGTEAETLRTTIASWLHSDKSQPAAALTLLFLNVDQLSPVGQAELVAVMQASLGNARIMATASESLLTLAAAGSFSPELAFALSTLVIELPALEERREDIPLLIQRMVEEYNASGGRQLAGFSPGALDLMTSLPWRGNVEELAAVVREACENVTSVWIGEGDLPAKVRAVVTAGLHPRREPESIELDAFLLEVERELMERAMARTKGNKSQAARLLGISRARLLRRLEQFGMIERAEPEIDFQLEEDDESDGSEERRETH